MAELDSTGAVVSRFVYGTRGNVPDYMIRGADTLRIVSDERGSVRMVVSVASGTTVQEIAYDSWGRVLIDTNPGFQPFGYAGGLYDGATGLVRFGARDYDARIGRWTVKDPVGLAGGVNIYAYVGGDPVNLVDPSGLCPQEDSGGRDWGDLVAAAAVGGLVVTTAPVSAPTALAGVAVGVAGLALSNPAFQSAIGGFRALVAQIGIVDPRFEQVCGSANAP